MIVKRVVFEEGREPPTPITRTTRPPTTRTRTTSEWFSAAVYQAVVVKVRRPVRMTNATQARVRKKLTRDRGGVQGEWCSNPRPQKLRNMCVHMYHTACGVRTAWQVEEHVVGTRRWKMIPSRLLNWLLTTPF